MTSRVVQQLATWWPPGIRGFVEGLTDQQVEVLHLVARGLTDKAIGQMLGIGSRTVQGHLANMYGKLSVGSRTEAVTEALNLGWITIK